MENKEAFDLLRAKLDLSLEEYNRSSGKKVMVIPKPNGEQFYIFNRKTVVIHADANDADVTTIEYYDGQKDVLGGVYDNAAEFVEKEELRCFIDEEPQFSFTTAANKKNAANTVNALLTRIFRGRIQ